MGALTTSDYAATSDGTKIYLYYQNDSNQIREVTSSDGSKWSESNAVVAENLNGGGSPITAYYVAYDGTANKKSTVKQPCAGWVAAFIKDSWANLCFVIGARCLPRCFWNPS